MMQIDEEALELLVNEGHSLAYGARFLKRVIDERVSEISAVLGYQSRDGNAGRLPEEAMGHRAHVRSNGVCRLRARA
jgi:hypothetical protein